MKDYRETKSEITKKNGVEFETVTTTEIIDASCTPQEDGWDDELSDALLGLGGLGWIRVKVEVWITATINDDSLSVEDMFQDTVVVETSANLSFDSWDELNDNGIIEELTRKAARQAEVEADAKVAATIA